VRILEVTPHSKGVFFCSFFFWKRDMRAGAPAVIFDDDFKDRNQALRMA
jgi:hypothetical protein